MKKNKSNHQEVYVAHCNGNMDGEQFSSIIGVYSNPSDAKRALEADIEDIKASWNRVDFEDNWSEEWGDDGLSYSGSTNYSDDYYCYDGYVDHYSIQ